MHFQFSATHRNKSIEQFYVILIYLKYLFNLPLINLFKLARISNDLDLQILAKQTNRDFKRIYKIL